MPSTNLPQPPPEPPPLNLEEYGCETGALAFIETQRRYLHLLNAEREEAIWRNLPAVTQ